MPFLGFRQTVKEKEKMYARDIKSVNIDGSVFHLIALDGVPTWCYDSGAIVTDNARLQFIAANA